MIDISDKIEQIKKECKMQGFCVCYEELGLDREECENNAADRVAGLWGFTPDMMTLQADIWHDYRFGNMDSVSVRLKNSQKFEIHVSQSPNGLWAVECDFFLSDWGRGAFPCIWNREQYESRKEAIVSEFERQAKDERFQSDKIGAKLIALMADKIAEMFPAHQQLELAL